MMTPTSPTYTPRFQDLDAGLRIAYLDEGSGPHTLVFLHGMGSNLRAWRKNIPAFRSHFRCISLDLPGFGQSRIGATPVSIAFYSEVLRQFLAALDIVRPTLVGHSMGGQVILRTLLDHPGTSDRAVLFAPAGLEPFSDEDIAWLAENYTPAMLQLMTAEHVLRTIDLYFHRTPADVGFMAEELEALRTGSEFAAYCRRLPECVLSMVQDPVHERLEEIGTDMLVVFGENDALIPHPRLHAHLTTREAVSQGAVRLRGAHTAYLPACGHFVQWEQSETVNAAVLRYLRDGSVNLSPNPPDHPPSRQI